VLEDDLNVILVNPAHAKGLPGRKSDVSDSMWLAQLGECGLLKPSFVPPAPIRQLRDLTRYRTTLSREHTREAARLEKELEDAGHKDQFCGHRHPGRVRPGDARSADRRGT
jgi:transposase